MVKTIFENSKLLCSKSVTKKFLWTKFFEVGFEIKNFEFSKTVFIIRFLRLCSMCSAWSKKFSEISDFFTFPYGRFNWSTNISIYPSLENRLAGFRRKYINLIPRSLNLRLLRILPTESSLHMYECNAEVQNVKFKSTQK